MNISKEMNLCVSSWMTQSELRQMGHINKKIIINSQLMTDPHFMIGIMLILKFNFQLQKLADGAGYAAADRITVINGSHSLIKHLMIKSAGKIIYDTDNLSS